MSSFRSPRQCTRGARFLAVGAVALPPGLAPHHTRHPTRRAVPFCLERTEPSRSAPTQDSKRAGQRRPTVCHSHNVPAPDQSSGSPDRSKIVRRGHVDGARARYRFPAAR